MNGMHCGVLWLCATSRTLKWQNRAIAARPSAENGDLLCVLQGSWWHGLCRAFALLERVARYVAKWALRDVPPVGRAAVYGSARMIKRLVVEAGRQSSLVAAF